ncbi:MAG: glycosyltransferase family 2 protein [Bacillota bacterium]|nr:glycosyltransferase family 2 protein [Bacillota bacterium]
MNNAPKERERALWLSIVVIGRNESAHLPALFASLPKEEDIEWIYVDSDSADHSVEVALEHGAAVYRIEPGSVYAPGTGRYAGTREARADWILYLDGDMVLRQEFRAFLNRLKTEIKSAENNLPPDTAAFTGRTINRLLNESGEVIGERDYVVLPKSEMGLPESWGKSARYHGGAVLYNKEYVERAGSWNPAVYQLEEIDLYSRVRSLGGVLKAVDLPMVDHYTPELTLSERLKLNFLPRWKGKKLYGLGQVVTARVKEGGLSSFMICYPQPFVVMAGLFAVVPFWFIHPLLPLFFNLGIFLWIGMTKRWYFYLVYLGNVLQMFRGLGRYQRFEPVYKKISEHKH